MTSALRRHAARLLLASLVLVSVACEQTDPLPPVTEAADAFFAAWAAGDVEEMNASFDATSAAEWSPGRLKDLFERTERQAALVGLQIERAQGPDPSLPAETGCDEDGPPPQEQIPYTITFDSEEVPSFQLGPGTLPLAFDCESRSWKTHWTRALLWPGVPDATGFQLQHRWQKRGHRKSVV